jgi:proline racemase
MYEVMSTMEMPNMPTSPQSQTPSRMMHCYSADDVKVINARQSVARGKIKNTRCTVTESSFVQNRSVWVTKCEGQGTVRYDTTYGGDNFESTVTTTSVGHESVIMRQKGRRVGECK